MLMRLANPPIAAGVQAKPEARKPKILGSMGVLIHEFGDVVQLSEGFRKDFSAGTLNDTEMLDAVCCQKAFGRISRRGPPQILLRHGFRVSQHQPFRSEPKNIESQSDLAVI